jgi:hypothetical protein
MMFVVALTICHLGHAAEPICVQENVKEAIPCVSAETGIHEWMRSHPRPRGTWILQYRFETFSRNTMAPRESRPIM